MTRTETLTAIRKAPPLASYPPLRLVPEPTIVDPVRMAECACGVLIVQRPGDAVPVLIAHHNGTEEHQRWREQREAVPLRRSW